MLLAVPMPIGSIKARKGIKTIAISNKFQCQLVQLKLNYLEKVCNTNKVPMPIGSIKAKQKFFKTIGIT